MKTTSHAAFAWLVGLWGNWLDRVYFFQTLDLKAFMASFN